MPWEIMMPKTVLAVAPIAASNGRLTRAALLTACSALAFMIPRSAGAGTERHVEFQRRERRLQYRLELEHRAGANRHGLLRLHHPEVHFN